MAGLGCLLLLMLSLRWEEDETEVATGSAHLTLGRSLRTAIFASKNKDETREI